MNLSPLHQVSLGHINRVLYIYLALAVVAMAFSFPELMEASGGGDAGGGQLSLYALPTMGVLLLCSFLMMQEKDSRRESPATLFCGWAVPSLFSAAAVYELSFIVLHVSPGGVTDWSWPVVHGLMLLACLHLSVSSALFHRLQRKLRREIREISRQRLQEDAPLRRVPRGAALPTNKGKEHASLPEASEELGTHASRGEGRTPTTSLRHEEMSGREEKPARRVRRFPRLCSLVGADTEDVLRTWLETSCAEMLRRSPWGNFARRGSDGRREDVVGVPEDDLLLIARSITHYILHESPFRPTLSRPCYMVGSVFEVEDFASLLSENLAEEVTSLYVRRDSSLRDAALVSLLFRYRWCAKSDKFFDPELLARLIQETGEAEERDEYRRKLMDALQEMRAC